MFETPEPPLSDEELRQDVKWSFQGVAAAVGLLFALAIVGAYVLGF